MCVLVFENIKILIVLFFVLTVNVVLCVDDNDTDVSKILFPNTKEIETREEIPIDLIRRLNQLANVEDFFKNMVEYEQPDLSDRMGVETFGRDALRNERSGKCMPEFRTISLKPNQSPTTFYYPPCVRVRRCGGCCLHDLFSCQPTEKKIVSVTVAIAEYRGGPQFRLKEREIIEIEEHTSCECGCRIRSQDCTKYQTYNEDNCRCECPNSEKAKRCYNKIWNPDICSCICRNELTCGTGFEFDFFTCSCIPSRGRQKTNFMYRIFA